MVGDSLLHYRILRVLGSGGMGEVYLAEDQVLHRRVALKLLPEVHAQDHQRRERMQREARALAALSHANIAAVHALETAGDRSFLVMEYIEGESLDRRIEGRPLPFPESISLGIALAEALAHAHVRGVVHRDVKPSNVMLTDEGKIKLTDFGLARLADRTTLTSEGVIAGTVGYMSPEQARGETLDGRSDVFSLGVVLYEAVTGTLPFSGDRMESVLYGIEHRDPEPLTARRSGVPLELERIVMKCLQKRRDFRYQHAEDLAADLKRLQRELEHGMLSSRSSTVLAALRTRPVQIRMAWGAAMLTMLGMGGWWLGARAGLWLPQGDSHTILILPLEVRGQAEGAEYVGRAFAEAIAVNLAAVKGLSVLPIPDRSGSGRRGVSEDALAARRVRAGSFLTGALTRSGDAVQVSLTLVDANRNRIRWGAEKTGSDATLSMLAAQFSGEVAGAAGAVPPSLYDSPLNLRGSPAMAATPEFTEAKTAVFRLETAPALKATRRLVEMFPGEVDAHVLRAFALLNYAFLEPARFPAWGDLEKSLLEINRLDPNNPWDELFRAIRLHQLEKRDRDAVDRLTRLLARPDLAPDVRSLTLVVRSWSLARIENAAAALPDLEEAVRLDPANPITVGALAEALASLGRYDEALDRARQAYAILPRNFAALDLGNLLTRVGRWEAAMPYLKQGYDPGDFVNPAVYPAAQAVVFQRGGHKQEARRAAQKAISALEFPGQVPGRAHYFLACYRVLNGEKAEALRLLRTAIERGYEDVALDRDPNLSALRGEPDFGELLTEMQRRLAKSGG